MVFQALRLEKEIRQNRINLALKYCFQKNISTDEMDENDLLAIYNLLVIKGLKQKEEILKK